MALSMWGFVVLHEEKDALILGLKAPVTLLGIQNSESRKSAGLKINTAINNSANRVAKKDKPLNSPKRRVKESHIDPAGGGPEFGPTCQIAPILCGNKNYLTIELQPFLEKFFLADNTWACYRRNYFSLSCKLFVKDDQHMYTPRPYFLYDRTTQLAREILRFEAGVEARVADGKKKIEILQHTPKRNKAQLASDMVLSPNSLLPEDNAVPKFERLQFKSATQNTRGKDKPQQYFQLLVVLYCIVVEEVLYDPIIYGPIKDRKGNLLNDDYGNPLVPKYIEIEKKIKVATKESGPFIVRGRSPGHYNDSETKMWANQDDVDRDEDTQEIPDSNTEYPESVLGNQEVLENPPTSNDITSDTLGPPSSAIPKMGPPTTPISPNIHRNFDTAYGGSCLWNDSKAFAVNPQMASYPHYAELPLSSYSRKVSYNAPTQSENGPLSAPIKKVDFFGPNQPWQYGAAALNTSVNAGTPIPTRNIPVITSGSVIRSNSAMLPSSAILGNTPQLTLHSTSLNDSVSDNLSQSFGNFAFSDSQLFESQNSTQYDNFTHDPKSFEPLSKDVVDALSVDLKFDYNHIDDSMPNMDP
ncbi:meiosis-specific transcription factor ndt80 [Boothiomyces sp. JEL0866]|nr:meiosis-specific transcription factor ndt80 [Boothiomyces sp. JEL0866]